MKIIRVSPIIFTGKIIDSHAHIGHHDGRNYTKEHIDVFVKEPLKNNDTIDKMLVSDLDVLYSLKDEYQGNKDALKLLSTNSKYVLVASCSPKNGNIENIKRLVSEAPDKIAGLKFHPKFQNLETTQKEYEPYMKFAQDKNLPCLFHTEVFLDAEGNLANEISKSDPESVYQLAKKYKTAPVILAHMGAGWNQAHDKAVNILVESIKNGDANLYADISWVDIDYPVPQGGEHHPKEHIIKAIKTLKGINDPSWTYGDQSYRLMFGTDTPLGRFNIKENPKALDAYADFVEDIKYAIREDKDLCKDAEKIIDDLFYNNAYRLYLEPLKKKDNPIKNNASGKLWKISAISTIFALIAGLGLYIAKSKAVMQNSKQPAVMIYKK